MQLPFGPGDPDEQQPPLLLDLPRRFLAPSVRQQIVLDADDVNPRKLQTLRRVQRHQRHPRRRRVVAVGRADQRDLFQIRLQRTVVGVLAVELRRAGDQFVQVRRRVIVLRFDRGTLQVFVVLRLAHDRPDQILHRTGGEQRQPVHHRNEPRDHRRATFWQVRDQPRFPGRVQHRLAAAVGVVPQRPDRLVPDAAGRRVDHTLQRDVVRRVVDQLQVTDQVLNLFALIELDAAQHLIRHAPHAHRLFDRPRQRVHPAKDRDVPGADLLRRHRPRDVLDDRPRFLPAVLVHPQHHRRPLVVLGEQLLGLPMAVVADQLIGHPQDVRRAAVILLQPDDFDVRIILFKIQDVVQVGAAPPVDRLVRVAGDGQVRMVDR